MGNFKSIVLVAWELYMWYLDVPDLYEIFCSLTIVHVHKYQFIVNYNLRIYVFFLCLDLSFIFM